MVLVVIGIILAAVSIGKDAQRNASYQKIMQTFVKPWAAAYGEYYSRNGIVLGDNTASPKGWVNDGGAALDGNDLCAAGGALIASGIECPTGNGTGNEGRYVYQDHAGTVHTLSVSFVHSSVDSGQKCAIRKSCNFLRLTGVTEALANMIDVAVDGVADRTGTSGKFRCTGLAATTLADEQAAKAVPCYWEMDF